MVATAYMTISSLRTEILVSNIGLRVYGLKVIHTPSRTIYRSKLWSWKEKLKKKKCGALDFCPILPCPIMISPTKTFHNLLSLSYLGAKVWEIVDS